VASSSRLPRGPHAERPRPGENVRKRTGADLQNGWLARHGTLSLTDERLVFVPTILDTLFRAKRREIPLDTLEEIERFPRNPGEFTAGGKRPRVLLHTLECVYEFMVPDLDAWIDAIEIVCENRVKRGEAERTPAITREGYTNLFKQLEE
jgi:hypothetical protein